MHCPLCRSEQVYDYHKDAKRLYMGCRQCDLVFVPAHHHLSPEQERWVYDQHENTLDDPGYRGFLNRLAEPMLQRLDGRLQGLDFGCGPGPALAQMMVEKGQGMAIFDPFYFPGKQVLDKQYDFVTCTEVVEHFNRPGDSWQQLMGLVRPGGILGIMTKRVIDPARFAGWHYKNDPTHISFYSDACLGFIANTYAKQLQLVDADVALFF